jgi:hypothetical protein
VLKTLFGTATVADIHVLQELLSEMRLKDADMSHMVDSQLTYVKEMGATTKINFNAITNMPSIIRDNISQSSERFQQVTRDML